MKKKPIILFVFLISGFSLMLSSCGQLTTTTTPSTSNDNNDESNDDAEPVTTNFGSLDDYLECPSIISALESNPNFDIEKEDDPPDITGVYNMNGSVTDSSKSSLIGTVMKSQVTLYDQKNTSISMKETLSDGTTAYATGNFIHGEGQYFTIYEEAQETLNGYTITTAVLMSGKLLSTGNITAETLSVITDVGGYPGASSGAWWRGGNVSLSLESLTTPTFSPIGGTYTSTQSVKITTSSSGASIRYTTDGTTPTSSHGMLYSSAITISKTTTLKAIAYEDGYANSSVATATYTIDTDDPESGADWTESFETYSSQSFPSSEWTADGNGTDSSTNYVDSEQSSSGNKSLKLFGENSSGASWGSLAYRSLEVTAPFEVCMDVRTGSEEMLGMQPNRAGVGLRKGLSWTNPGRGFLTFNDEGKIVDANGDALRSYSTGTWYSLDILYERPTDSTVKITYVINDVSYGSTTVEAKTSEDGLNNLNLSSAQGSSWFDNIKVYQW